MNKAILATAIGAMLACSTAATAADLNLLNMDAPGVGLNDATPSSPIGGNPGQTRGEQARIVYQFAMDMWGGVLESPIDIDVWASFAPLSCTSTGGTLARAGANALYALNEGPGTPDRVYGAALAEALLRRDMSDPADPADIFSEFNGNLGYPGCLDGMSWYFGLDGNTPDGQINFLNVVMHELGHGLGMQGFVFTGNILQAGTYRYGISDPYTYNAYDNVINKRFEDMTNSERRTALITAGRTVWTGANVNREAALILSQKNLLQATAPAAISGQFYDVGYANFGPLATPQTFINRQLVLINDGTAPTANGCEPIYTNAAEVAGKIAVIDRGTCGFSVKVKYAEDNGALAAIIVNSAAGVQNMDATAGFAPTIPAILISQADGNTLKANIAAGAQAGMALSPYLAGTDRAGRTRLYTPAALAPGSTYSHFDTQAHPDALMEPFDSPTVQAQFNTDMTPGLFADIGWTINPGNGKLGSCDTGVDAVADGGIVIGANVQATSNVCLINATNRGQYQSCMAAYKQRLLAAGLITGKQAGRITSCAAKLGK